MVKMYYINPKAFERFRENNPNLKTRRLRVLRFLGNGMYEMQWVDTPFEPSIHIHEMMLTTD